MAVLDAVSPATLSVLMLVVLALILVLTLANLVRRLFSTYGLPHDLPWVGAQHPNTRPISRAQAQLRSFFNLRKLLDEGYEKVSILEEENRVSANASY